MKKIASIILLCSLFIFCFSGCLNLNDETGKNTSDQDNETTSTPSTDEPGENTLSPEDEAYLADLHKTFDTIKADVQNNAKLAFNVQYEQLYYEFKASGQYDNSRWTNPGFEVFIHYVHEEAADEEWYKQCVDKNIKSLNDAFFNQYSEDLSHSKYSNLVYSPVIYLRYHSLEDFEKDYAAIKALADLAYVTEAHIQYYFPIPYDWMEE